MTTNKYNICFVGLGSIAQRHIRNLRDIFQSREIECNIDVLRSGNGGSVELNIINNIDNIYYNPEEMNRHYDAIFITNPTAKHFETISTLGHRSNNFFIEKPVFHSSHLPVNELPMDGKLYYVACPLRYTGVIQHLKDNLNKQVVRNVRVVSGSYLPDWRPNTDYRKSYSAKKSLGGGVSIDLIHEWDYVVYLFGMPQKTVNIIKKVSDLEIDSDDIATYIADYGDKIIEIHLDYFSRKPIRRIEITTDRGIISADLIKQEIITEKEQLIEFHEERDVYQKRELEYFLEIIEGKKVNSNDIHKAIDVLRLAEGC